ncbi:MAG: hypothetical protein WB817_04660 [Terriglobales bacterium]
MPNSETADQAEASQHLALVRSLSAEISSAISAIERNDMSELSSRIAAQEVICHKLSEQDPQRLKRAIESYRAAAQPPANSSIFEKIREAHRALAQLNRVYAGVVSRSQRSIELITNLYRNHGQRYDKDDKTRPAQHNWSCEA